MKERRRPIRDPEVIELLADDPELLAVADAIWATADRDRARAAARRYVAPRRLALIAAAVAAAAVVAAIVPRGGTGRALAARAVAAIGDGRVVHLRVSRSDTAERVVDLASGVQHPSVLELESWFDSRTGELRTRTVRNGVVVADTLVVRGVAPVRGGNGAGAPQADPLVAGFIRGYRRALKAGDVRLLRHGRMAGVPILWVEVRVKPGMRDEVALNAHTYIPLAVRSTATGRDTPLWSVQTIGSVPRIANEFRPHVSRVRAVRGEVIAEEQIPLTSVPRALGHDGTWAGDRVLATRLRRIARQTLRSFSPSGSSRVSAGIELTYRATNGSFVQIREAREPAAAYGFASGVLTLNFGPIPRQGKAVLTPPAGASGIWLGQLRVSGLFVEIRGSTENLVLTTARRLKPLPG